MAQGNILRLVHFSSATFLTVLASVIVITMSKPALAYIDAGVGSLILQLLLGGIGGLLVVIKLYWYRIKGLLPFRQPNETHNHNDDETPK